MAIAIVIKRMKNLSQVIKAKNDNWTDLLVFRLVYGIHACACALAMHDAKPACAHDYEQQRNVLCHQNVFSTKPTRYWCRAALHLYPFLVFSNENSTSFFLEPTQKLLLNCTYRKRWNNMHLESTFVASSPFDTVEISRQNTLKKFLCRFFSTTIRPCNNALTWSISHVSTVNCDHKSNQWKSNDYSFQAVHFYSIGIVLPFRNLDDYCKSFMLHFLHISAVFFFGCWNILVSMHLGETFLNLNLYENEIKASAKMAQTLWTLTTIPFIRAITFNKQLNNEWLLSYLENFLWNHNKMHTHTH